MPVHLSGEATQRVIAALRNECVRQSELRPRGQIQSVVVPLYVCTWPSLGVQRFGPTLIQMLLCRRVMGAILLYNPVTLSKGNGRLPHGWALPNQSKDLRAKPAFSW